MTLIALRPSRRMVHLARTLGKQWYGYAAQCRCPAHKDDEPSLSIRHADGGSLIHRFAECTPTAVLKALDTVVIIGGQQPPERDSGLSIGAVERLWAQAFTHRIDTP